MKKLTVRDMADIAIVAAIYVVLTITPPINVLSFGAYQFRISEMLNFLAFYNPKYIIGQFVEQNIDRVNTIETILAQILIIILNYILSKIYIFKGNN